MAGNSFGLLFRLTSFGESHGPALGGIIDGCPAGLTIDKDFIQKELDRRRPGQSKIVSQRKESDAVEFLSGILNGISTGTPIGFIIRNENQKKSDYDHLTDAFRPSHADYTYEMKYGIRDVDGGGRSSARETVARVVAGAIAKLFLREKGISVTAYTSQVGEVRLLKSYRDLDFSEIDANPVRCPDKLLAETMQRRIEQVRKEGDTIGGIVTCIAKGVPAGLGEPVFDKLHADLGKAMLSINAVKGFEYGSGFEGVTMNGSRHNDAFVLKDGAVHTATNHSGGIQGGISNGEDICFRVAFKPVATIMQDQKTVKKTKEGKFEEVELSGKGRHDPCVLPRAVPIVEAMAALVLMDHYLRNRNNRISKS